MISEPRTFLDGRVILHAGDCREVLRGMADNSVDSVVTDPPYALVSIGKRFGKDGAAPAKSSGATGVYARASSGFMMVKWDTGAVAFDPELWVEVCRVMKPGAHGVAMGSTRTFHRLVCAIEDAGAEIRDQLIYCFGSGFPKNHSINKALYGKVCNCERTPPISECDLRRVPNSDVSTAESVEEKRNEVLLNGMSEQSVPKDRPQALADRNTGGVKKSRMEGWGDSQEAEGKLQRRSLYQGPGMGFADGEERPLYHGASPCNGSDVRVPVNENRSCQSRGSQPGEQSSEQPDTLSDECGLQARGSWPICGRCSKPIIPEGLGTALKPSFENICLFRKPLSESSISANVLLWGTGAINVGVCRVGPVVDNRRPKGNGETAFPHSDDSWRSHIDQGGAISARWPANLLHDNSEEVLACFPDREAGGSKDNRGVRHNVFEGATRESVRGDNFEGYDDSGSAARFFASFPEDEDDPAAKRIIYTPKADQDSRLGSRHPCVKPLKLIQYLVRLITPPGGTVLDCFAGTGTTAEAAYREGFRAILIEREAESIKDIERRMSLVMEGPVTRAHAGMKARGRPVDNGPLFGGNGESPRRGAPSAGKQERGWGETNLKRDSGEYGQYGKTEAAE